MKFSLLVALLFMIHCALVSVLCDEQVQSKASATVQMESKRAFYDTPYGQIHYMYGGEFNSADSTAVYCTFLLFHGNPRSTDEFTELIHELGYRFVNRSTKFSYIAMDLLGEGHSDDALVSAIDPSSGYVSMEQYSEIMIDIARQVFEKRSLIMKVNGGFSNSNIDRYIVPFGSLTGSAIATEVSYILKLKNGISSLCRVGTCKILTTILHDPMYYFSDQIVANVHSYADQQRKWQPKEDGEHLAEIWNDPNYQPYKDLALQDRKSLDRFRAATTQWQVILGYADYSSRSLLGRLTALSQPSRAHSAPFSNSQCLSVPPLVIFYGGEFLNDTMMEKFFEVQEMRSIIANATKGGSYEIVVDGGNQALLSQNVTVVADVIMKQIIGV